MTRIAALACFVLVSLMAWPALPATLARTPTRSEVDCSGIYAARAPRTAGYVISGEEARGKLLFSQGDTVYLHLAAGSATRLATEPGEQFLVIRQAKDPIRISWFHGQRRLEKHMGRLWEDIGRVRVVRLAGKVVIARVENSCAPMERGDNLVRLEPRAIPSLSAAQPKDISAILSRPAVGRVVSAKGFRQVLAAGYIAYVDWGARQGAKTGDRLLLFRRPGVERLAIDRATGNTTGISGFGRSGMPRVSGRLPRVILGQAVVLRVSPTAATILITSTRREIELGDYAALE